MPQKEARDIAIDRIREQLFRDLPLEDATDLETLCIGLGLTVPRNGTSELRVFGKDLRLDWHELELSASAPDGSGRLPASQTDRILLFHYLASQGPTRAGGDLISFRDLTGGIFYWEPFRSRTVAPLAKRFGDDHAGLRKALGKYDWEEVAAGDFGARVHGFGNLWLTLVCYRSEDGLPAEINALFDPCLKKVFQAEDAAVFASRICIGLLG